MLRGARPAVHGPARPAPPPIAAAASSASPPHISRSQPSPLLIFASPDAALSKRLLVHFDKLVLLLGKLQDDDAAGVRAADDVILLRPRKPAQRGRVPGGHGPTSTRPGLQLPPVRQAGVRQSPTHRATGKRPAGRPARKPSRARDARVLTDPSHAGPNQGGTAQLPTTPPAPIPHTRTPKRLQRSDHAKHFRGADGLHASILVWAQQIQDLAPRGNDLVHLGRREVAIDGRLRGWGCGQPAHSLPSPQSGPQPRTPRVKANVALSATTRHCTLPQNSIRRGNQASPTHSDGGGGVECEVVEIHRSPGPARKRARAQLLSCHSIPLIPSSIRKPSCGPCTATRCSCRHCGAACSKCGRPGGRGTSPPRGAQAPMSASLPVVIWVHGTRAQCIQALHGRPILRPAYRHIANLGLEA